VKAEETGGIFALPDGDFVGELSEEILITRYFRIERIISRGHASPPGHWYDQDTNEWVAVLKGRARLLFEGSNGLVELGPGSHLNIPAHRRHRVEWTDPEGETIWLAVHYPCSGEDG